MRLRHIKGCEEFVWNSEYTINNPELLKGTWKRPLHIEIGMGKGQFIRKLARKHPEIEYIGIERYETVIQKAIERLARDEEENGKLDNLKFICMDAERLPVIFEKGEVEKIYLNFSDPWPKARHEHRRLTSKYFLSAYDKVLADDGTIEFKTDNNDLFEYSLESIPQAGWEITYMTRDLHAQPEAADNIMTEYEEKFSEKGQNINKLIARR